jgi:phosphatidate cytidylyltransferase
LDEQTSLVKRLCYSFLFISVSVYAIFWAPHWFFFLTVEAFSLAALYEFYQLAEKKGIFINKVLGLIFGALLPFSFYFQGESVIILVTILCLFIFNFHRRLKSNSLVSTAVTVFGIFYIAWLFSFFTKVKHLEDGTYWVAYILLVTKLGDTAAYFVGKSLGKRPLISHISPHKTVEGAIANFLICVIVSLLASFFIPKAGLVHCLVLGAALGILSQLGDLAESLIKRDVDVKDSGRVPGLGGFLDMIDSLLFTVPFTYYYLTAFIRLQMVL